MAADLAHDTAARADPSTPGRYRIDLPAHWGYILPSGGVAMTAALRAAEAHLAEPRCGSPRRRRSSRRRSIPASSSPMST